MFGFLFAITLGCASAAPFLNVTCSSGVHIIVARGSNEAPGEGRIGSVTTLIKQAIPGSRSEAITYPATLNNYQSSETQGVAAMVQAIASYVRACPNGRFALLGYSQGAQVIGDALGGGSFDTAAPIDAGLTTNCMCPSLALSPNSSSDCGRAVCRSCSCRW